MPQPTQEERTVGQRQARIVQMRYLVREPGRGVAHLAPAEDSDEMACCGLSVFDAGPNDTLVDHLSTSTCPAAQPADTGDDWYR